MGGSFEVKPGGTAKKPGGILPPKIAAPKARLGATHHLMARRRIRQKPFFAAFVVLSIALTVVVSYIITIMVSRNVQQLAATAQMTALPYDALVIFQEKGQADRFIQKSKDWRRRVYLQKCYAVKGDSSFGPVILLGSDSELPLDTARFLGSPKSPDGPLVVFTTWSPPSPRPAPGAQMYDFSSKPRGAAIALFTRLEWSKVESDPLASKLDAFSGWVKVNPKTIEKVPDAIEVVTVRFHQMYDTVYLRNAIYADMTSTLKGFPTATLISPAIGQENLKDEAGRAFSLWHAVSVIVVLASAASISCVLTVSFLGRKRSLGIMRVLGTTIGDLRHMMIIEASYLGIPGILLGLLGGNLLAKFFLGTQGISSGPVIIGTLMGILTLTTGVWLPLRLVRNASCDQLLNNRPVYVMSNPSCANCGLCGGV